MTRYARVSDGVVAEIMTLAIAPAGAFHPDVAATIHECPDDVAEGWTYADGAFAAPVEPVPTGDDLTAYAAARRWIAETGGITVAGVRIETDRNSQSMITGAYAWSQANPSATIAFKSAAGFVTLTAAEIAAIASAVGTHVQACFVTEAAVAAAIAAGSITSYAAIDAADWPA